ncbi:hypothetical protein K490DRAFT_70149, partial [Saccharata proteae CBS 121410]
MEEVADTSIPNGKKARMTFYDSSIQARLGSIGNATNVARLKRGPRRLQWWERSDTEPPRLAWEEQEGVAQRQANSWECGIHTILNGWAIALGLALKPDRSRTISDQDWKDILTTIQLAVAGYVSSIEIHAMLIYLEWVFPDSKISSGPDGHSFERTIKMFSLTDLDNHYDDQKQKDDDRTVGIQVRKTPSPTKISFDIHALLPSIPQVAGDNAEKQQIVQALKAANYPGVNLQMQLSELKAWKSLHDQNLISPPGANPTTGATPTTGTNSTPGVTAPIGTNPTPGATTTP